MKLITAWCMAFVVAVPVTVAAHSGGTDKNGCHVNRKTGDRHCHGGRAGAVQTRPQGLVGSGRPGEGAYINCAAAHAAGAAPVRQGELGYGPHLDRDGDGVGCER
jgi:hypothetical protein